MRSLEDNGYQVTHKSSQGGNIDILRVFISEGNVYVYVNITTNKQKSVTPLRISLNEFGINYPELLLMIYQGRMEVKSNNIWNRKTGTITQGG